MQHADITIIGGGVVGLAVAAEVARRDREVYVLEKNDTFGKETSSRNSGVIHAGIHFPKGSLKTILCLEGNNLLYQLCDKYAIPHRKTGKLIVAANDTEFSQLEVLMACGAGNGVKGLELVSEGQLCDMEPDVQGVAATPHLWV